MSRHSSWFTSFSEGSVYCRICWDSKKIFSLSMLYDWCTYGYNKYCTICMLFMLSPDYLRQIAPITQRLTCNLVLSQLLVQFDQIWCKSMSRQYTYFPNFLIWIQFGSWRSQLMTVLSGKVKFWHYLITFNIIRSIILWVAVKAYNCFYS